MQVRSAVCPGSFDPVTNGHVDIVERAAKLFDQVTVVVAVKQKKAGLFTVEERIEMLTEVTKAHPNVRVDSFEGLLVSYCVARGIGVIVKGLRVGDFDYELQMAQMNQRLAGVETLFLPTSATYSYLSSSLLKEVAAFGGDVAGLVPDSVARRLADRLAGR